MSKQVWDAVDTLVGRLVLGDDPGMTKALQRNTDEGLPAIDVSPAQGKLLHLLVKITGAKRILEVGTLGAYSTIWLARALPEGGKVVTLELEQHHADVARKNIADAGLAEKVEVIVGPAVESLKRLQGDKAGPFDFVFIDADKPNNVNYLTAALTLSRPGTVIVLDNVIRNGDVADETSADPNVQGAQAALKFIGSHPRLDGTAIQTVGAKGYDGFAIAIVRSQ
ncbi:MAG: O-methyltransferase [Rhizobiaceae bacterium]